MLRWDAVLLSAAGAVVCCCCCLVLHQVADPLRHFVDGLLSLPNPIGSVGDKVNVGIFRCVCDLPVVFMCLLCLRARACG